MDAVNIANHGGFTSNYRLRGEPVKLQANTFRWFVPDGDDWAPAPVSEEETSERYRSAMRLRGSRKQRAAREAIPLSTITLVTTGTPVAPGVARAIYEDRTEEEVKIAELEARIRQLMAIAARPNPAPTPGHNLDRLVQVFENKRPK